MGIGVPTWAWDLKPWMIGCYWQRPNKKLLSKNFFWGKSEGGEIGKFLISKSGVRDFYIKTFKINKTESLMPAIILKILLLGSHWIFFYTTYYCESLNNI